MYSAAMSWMQSSPGLACKMAAYTSPFPTGHGSPGLRLVMLSSTHMHFVKKTG
jgi:hypothetical protein